MEVDIHGGVLGVFERHRWIELSETIEESFVAPLPGRDNRAAVRLRLRIVSRRRIFKNIEWNADAIAELPKPPCDASPATALDQGAKAHKAVPEQEKAIR